MTTQRKTLWAWTLSTFFGAGYLKPGPGTYGSIFAILLWFAAAWLLYRFAPHTFPTLNSTTLALSIACTTLVLAGCWTMLRASRPSA